MKLEIDVLRARLEKVEKERTAPLIDSVAYNRLLHPVALGKNRVFVTDISRISCFTRLLIGEGESAEYVMPSAVSSEGYFEGTFSKHHPTGTLVRHALLTPVKARIEITDKMVERSEQVLKKMVDITTDMIDKGARAHFDDFHKEMWEAGQHDAPYRKPEWNSRDMEYEFAGTGISAKEYHRRKARAVLEAVLNG